MLYSPRAIHTRYSKLILLLENIDKFDILDYFVDTQTKEETMRPASQFVLTNIKRILEGFQEVKAKKNQLNIVGTSRLLSDDELSARNKMADEISHIHTVLYMLGFQLVLAVQHEGEKSIASAIAKLKSFEVDGVLESNLSYALKFMQGE